MDEIFAKGMKARKTYDVRAFKIEKNRLYFTYDGEELYATLYEDYNDKVFDEAQIIQVRVNKDPFNNEYYYTCEDYLLTKDLKSIYQKSLVQSKLNIEGKFPIKIKNIEFRPIRNVYAKDNTASVLGNKVFAGVKVEFSFVDKIASDDCSYLSLRQDDEFKINAERVEKDLKRLRLIFSRYYQNDTVASKKFDVLMGDNIDKMNSIFQEMKADIDKKEVIVTLVAKRNGDEKKTLFYYIDGNEFKDFFAINMEKIKDFNKEKETMTHSPIFEITNKDESEGDGGGENQNEFLIPDTYEQGDDYEEENEEEE